MKITLPWPDTRLNPNNWKGQHWGVTSKLRSQEKEAAFWRSRDVVGRTDSRTVALLCSNPLRVDITFNAPNKRKRDLDNLLSALKPSLDGIALSLGIDDERFQLISLRRVFVHGRSGSVDVELAVIA
ncbi:hypothetical protein EJP67_18530 [Variovorax guangxiensis]|uniref:Uncharacterized protein n=1 Tax=Variovorax guangxiensis TaxID=1775474 RepID=A0A3S1F2C6_9BURK|nr:hypothetical protein [Variovorax guangxiensis]RUR69058.1 hypothetical protein EJP67_18530 [Variovorax guangxiensis]